MHYSGTTYRPPYESESLLLQVTSGCSHNSCTFCGMYRDMPFEVSPIEEIEEDLASVARYGAMHERMFLVNGDAFCLSFERLVEIAELVHRYLPGIESIGGYASINNVLAKTEDELRELARLGYADFNIGLESGLDDVRAAQRRGHAVQPQHHHGGGRARAHTRARRSQRGHRQRGQADARLRVAASR